MKNVLVTAYDVNPYRGSESATGWNFPINIAKHYQVTLVTRENNIPIIEKYVAENDVDTSNIEFVGFDLPYWARFWKKGARGSFLYFYLWQMFLGISFFSKRHLYDVCHSLNFHCDWSPSFLWLLGKPFVWGPINHNEKLPTYILEKVSKGERFRELIKQVFKIWFWRFDPFLHICKWRATKILVGHEDVISRLNLSSSKCELFNQISAVPKLNVEQSKSDDSFDILFVGRGLLLKNYMAVLQGFKLSLLDASEKHIDLRLTFVGVGKQAKRQIEAECSELALGEKIDIVDWVSFEDMPLYYKKAKVLCFPSFEGAGMVIAESLSFGRPVITIDRNGAAHELSKDCSYVVDSSSWNGMIQGISESILELASDDEKWCSMSNESLRLVEEKMSWAAKAKRISSIYSAIK